MFDFKNEKAFIYRVALPVIQIIAFVLFFLAMLFDDKLERTSDILMITSIAFQVLALSGLGVKELLIRKNRVDAFLYFGSILVVFSFIIYIIIVYK